MARWSTSVNIPCHIQLELIRQFSNGDASLHLPEQPEELPQNSNRVEPQGTHRETQF